MLMQILNNIPRLPISCIAFLLTIFFFVLGLGIIYFRDTFLKRDKFVGSEHLVLRLSGLSCPIFAFLLASVAVMVISKRDEIRDSFQVEMESISDVILLEEGFPIDLQKKISNHLKDYLLFIKNQQWKAIAEGKILDQGNTYISKALGDFYVYFDTHPGNVYVAKSLINKLEKINDARKNLSQLSMKRIHPYLWGVLFVSAIFNLFIIIFFLNKKIAGQILGLCITSVLFGLIFSFLIAFDNPFTGSLAIEFGDIDKYLSLMAIK